MQRRGLVVALALYSVILPASTDKTDPVHNDDQWQAAIDTGADWVIITSWNEWWDNTEIEPGKRYGRTFLDRTRVWASLFKR